MSMLRVGQMVVCVKTFTGFRFPDEIVPEKNGIYTIRSFIEYAGEIGLRLVEIINPPHRYAIGMVECAFKIAYFRPIREQSIEIFREIANGIRQPEKETV